MDVNKLTPQQILAQANNNIKVQDDDIVVCNKCQSEFFVSPIRLAKKKVDLKNEAVGLIHEQPHAFCFNCREMLPQDITVIKTKKDIKEQGPKIIT